MTAWLNLLALCGCWLVGGVEDGAVSGMEMERCDVVDIKLIELEALVASFACNLLSAIIL